MYNIIKLCLIALFFIATIFTYIYFKSFTTKDLSAKTIIVSDSNINDTDKILDMSLENKEKIEGVIKEYLLNNPNIIIESFENFKKNKLKENTLKSKQYIKNNKDILTDMQASIVLGKKDSNKIIICFFDYSCSYCRKAGKYIANFLESNKDVKFILRPTPILGEISDYLVRLIFVINKIAPSKLVSIHNAILSMNQLTKHSLEELLHKNNLDVSLIMDEMENDDIKSLVKHNMDIATNVKIQSVPTYIINDEIISGVLDVSQLEKYLVKEK
jgi:protein-disulfide isomerase